MVETKAALFYICLCKVSQFQDLLLCHVVKIAHLCCKLSQSYIMLVLQGCILLGVNVIAM